MVQINDDYYEDLDYESTAELIEKLSRDEVPPAGSVQGRQGSQALPGPTSLAHVISSPKTTKQTKSNAKAKDGGV